MMKFDVQRAVTPARAATLPKLKNFAPGPSPGPPRKRLASAECVLCVYKLAPDASVVWDDVKDPSRALWQVQLEHLAKDSLLANFYDRFVAFLRDTEDLTVQDLRQGGIKLVITDTQDSDGVGFVQWRPALYTAGGDAELYNVLLLLDSFFVWSHKSRDKTVTVDLYPARGINLDPVWGDLAHTDYNLYEPTFPPLKFWSATPVQGKKYLNLVIQIESEDVVSYVFYSCTWPYRKIFDELGAIGYYHEESGNVNYYRVLAKVNVENKPDFASLCLLRVTVDGELSGAVADFVASLKLDPQCYFA